MTKETKLRIYNITAKVVLKFNSEAWVLKKRDEQRLEASQMKFLRHLLGITKLDQEKNQSTNWEIQQYHQKWLQNLEGMDTKLNTQVGTAV
jgi:hypothetical protein